MKQMMRTRVIFLLAMMLLCPVQVLAAGEGLETVMEVANIPRWSGRRQRQGQRHVTRTHDRKRWQDVRTAAVE